MRRHSSAFITISKKCLLFWSSCLASQSPFFLGQTPSPTSLPPSWPPAESTAGRLMSAGSPGLSRGSVHAGPHSTGAQSASLASLPCAASMVGGLIFWTWAEETSKMLCDRAAKLNCHAFSCSLRSEQDDSTHAYSILPGFRRRGEMVLT